MLSFPHAVIEGICLTNVLGILGFKQNEVVINFQFLPMLKIGVKAQGKGGFVIDVGIWKDAPMNPGKVWDEACASWNDSNPQLAEMWERAFYASDVYGKTPELVKALLAHGYDIRQSTWLGHNNVRH